MWRACGCGAGRPCGQVGGGAARHIGVSMAAPSRPCQPSPPGTQMLSDGGDFQDFVARVWGGQGGGGGGRQWRAGPVRVGDRRWAERSGRRAVAPPHVRFPTTPSPSDRPAPPPPTWRRHRKCRQRAVVGVGPRRARPAGEGWVRWLRGLRVGQVRWRRRQPRRRPHCGGTGGASGAGCSVGRGVGSPLVWQREAAPRARTRPIPPPALCRPSAVDDTCTEGQPIDRRPTGASPPSPQPRSLSH